MPTYNRMTGLGITGIPVLILMEFANYGRGTQSYEEKRLCLHKLYSYLRAYIPVQFDKDKKIAEYNEKIAPLLNSASDFIEIARSQYKPTFEGIQTCDPDEKIFQQTMDGIFEKLSEIAAISKVIDKEKFNEEFEVG